MSNEVWGELYDRLAELIQSHNTTLIFVNNAAPRRARGAPSGRAASARSTSPPTTAACRRSIG